MSELKLREYNGHDIFNQKDEPEVWHLLQRKMLFSTIFFELGLKGALTLALAPALVLLRARATKEDCTLS
jgi:hypothetical protein